MLVSAGPTYEDIDPVRFIGNRSSGRMGFAVARTAVEQGARVQLVVGPVHLPTPAGVERTDVRSARDMRAAVLRQIPQSDIFISATAVGDYRPGEVATHKLKKRGADLTLTLNENPDILAEIAALPKRPLLVGFAAETENVEAYARAKLTRKKLDLIAAIWSARSRLRLLRQCADFVLGRRLRRPGSSGQAGTSAKADRTHRRFLREAQAEDGAPERKVIDIELKILDARLGKEIPLPEPATVASAGMDLRAAIDAPLTLEPDRWTLISAGLAIHIGDPG